MQGLAEIGDQVVAILQAHRQAHEPFGNSHLGLLLGREALMGCRVRMTDQTLRISEIVGDVDQLEPVKGLECRRLADLTDFLYQS